MIPTQFEKLKVVKELSRTETVFAIERVPGTRRFVFGGSDFQIYDADLSKEKPEVRKWGGHESYVTGIALADRWAVSGAYDGKLIWWDLESGLKLRTVDA